MLYNNKNIKLTNSRTKLHRIGSVFKNWDNVQDKATLDLHASIRPHIMLSEYAHPGQLTKR